MQRPKRLGIVRTIAALVCSLLIPNSFAASVQYDLLNSTPVGSWQLREDINTDHKGRKTVSVMRTSMLGSEMREGKKFYWIEMVMDSYRLKKDKRKKDGDQMVLKTLVPEASLQVDPANIMTNLRGFLRK